MGQGLFVIEASRSHSEKPQTVGLFWTGDQPVSETSTWQHKTPTTYRLPQDSSGRVISPTEKPLPDNTKPFSGYGGIRTYNPNKRTAAFRRLRSHSHCQPSRTEPNRADSAWKRNLRYEMEAFTLHAEPSRTEPDRAWPSVFDSCRFIFTCRATGIGCVLV